MKLRSPIIRKRESIRDRVTDEDVLTEQQLASCSPFLAAGTLFNWALIKIPFWLRQ